MDRISSTWYPLSVIRASVDLDALISYDYGNKIKTEYSFIE